ncbi:MAG: transglycosylase domain-containing protein [Deltaproteobacteria bacterium]
MIMINLLKRKRLLVTTALLLAAAVGGFIWKTRSDLLPLPRSLTLDGSNIRKVQVLDRHNLPLTVTYQNRWNIHDYVPLHRIPSFLQQAFVISEDQRFYQHQGVDWRARLHALGQNMKALRAVRGASTISEQVIRMWHPRPRTVWSRWLEGLEAARLEERYSKPDILEFYLNQVPYAAKRHGVVQAARYYFDRDLDTLSQKEMLALVVMVRAPGRFDLHKGCAEIKGPLDQLADRLLQRGLIAEAQCERIKNEPFQIKNAELPVQASHFVNHIYQSQPPSFLLSMGRLQTTLDSSLQYKIQTILDNRLHDLQKLKVGNGAVLVVDNRTHEVLAWVNGGGGRESSTRSWIDAITTPRQPGSTLKPFLYALAFERGWTPATMVADLPLTKPVGVGLHTYHNYSRTHYGLLRVREALGNSLNTPAVRTVQYVGVETFLQRLHDLGIESLQQHPDFYGDGLALGNGEITLLELVRAYCVLAQRGIYHPLHTLIMDDVRDDSARRIFSPEASSLIGSILSDPEARKLEFGHGSLLRFPVQTAVKTGTSSDYRDSWAVGFNDRYTVGAWMGNLDGTVTEGITGSTGPGLVLRSVFAELNRHRKTRPLYLSPRLVKLEVCSDTGFLSDGVCPSYNEWFIPGTEPAVNDSHVTEKKSVRLLRPTSGLQLAMDPRIPDDQEAFSFALEGIPGGATVDWFVDDALEATTSTGEFVWPLRRGVHLARTRVRLHDSTTAVETPPVKFIVK